MSARSVAIMMATAAMSLTWTGQAWGQAGTAVQLPTWSQFSTSTTVTVPDRGSTYLGGVDRARSGASQFGSPLLPFGNRAFGGSRSASGMSVSVTVHDFEAMDEYLLGQSTGFRAVNPRRGEAEPDPWAARLRRAQLNGAQAPTTVADADARRARRERAEHAEAIEFFQRGQRAEEAGKQNVAKIYYQMAARRAAAPLKQQIVARLERLEPVRVAGNRDARGSNQ